MGSASYSFRKRNFFEDILYLAKVIDGLIWEDLKELVSCLMIEQEMLPDAIPVRQMKTNRIFLFSLLIMLTTINIILNQKNILLWFFFVSKCIILLKYLFCTYQISEIRYKIFNITSFFLFK
jgi:hypothetical protein